MDVTFKPVVFNNKPVEDAKTIKSIERCVLESWIALSRTNDSLPNAADYTSGYENVLGHGGTIEIRVAKISTGLVTQVKMRRRDSAGNEARDHNQISY
jgi:hypothetical protein